MRPAYRHWARGFVWLVVLTVAVWVGQGVISRRAVRPTPTSGPSASPAATATIEPSPVPSDTPTEGSAAAVPTSKPSPTPRPARPITKLGPEISRGTNVVLGKPKVIKLRNATREYVAELRQQMGPDGLIVVRFHDQADTNIDPRQSARDWHGRMRSEMLAFRDAGAPNIAFETGVNEPTNEQMDWLVPYSLEVITLMHNDGLHCVAGNPAVGNWSEEVWPKFKPVIDILRPGDYVGLHEYWVDTADIANPWHCGRWTLPPIATVLGNTRIVITECGRDQVEGRGKPGWKRTCSEEDYLWDLETYDILLNQHPNVVGATVFTLDKDWPDFDVYNIWPQVVYRYGLTPTPQP
ncbi:MAG: hypothetical protein ACUVX9_14000 [Anaerolineae bacterium]